MKRYLVAIKDAEIFLFENEENTKWFIADILKKYPKAEFAISSVGEDDQARAG